MSARRITIFTGHYGSGKTSLAVACALRLRAAGKTVTIADLDIVNPYFRTAGRRDELAARGVRVVCSPYANSNLDIPALPGELYAAVAGSAGYAVLDVGGDDRGAVALGRFAPDILAGGDYEMAFVVNFYRPLTQTAAEALSVLREVEAASGVRCTGLINNSNLGTATTAADVLATLAGMAGLVKRAELPLLATACGGALHGELRGRVENLFAIGPEPPEGYYLNERKDRNGSKERQEEEWQR